MTNIEIHRKGIVYTKSFKDGLSYVDNQCVTISGEKSLLGVNGQVSGTSYQSAFFGTS